MRAFRECRTASVIYAVNTWRGMALGGCPSNLANLIARHPDGGPAASYVAVDQVDEETYRKHADELTRFATGLVGPSEAQDVVSAAVFRAMTSRQWPEARNRRAYLFRSVLNEVRMRHRASRRRSRREMQAALPIAELSPETDLSLRLLVSRHLTTQQRAVILLTYWADLDVASISSLLGVSEGSVKRHLARGRARLRKVMTDDE